MAVNNAATSAYYRLLNLYRNSGKKFQVKPNTTLNEKHNILPNISLGNSYPIINYFGIGIGGNETLFNVLKTSEHSVIDGSLFKQVPFLILEKSKDLTISERKDYRLRKETVYNGKEYVEYYLKKITSISEPDVYKVTKTGELTNRVEPFNFNDASILNPEPKVKEDFTTASKESYIAVTMNITFSFTPIELRNIRESIRIKYGEDIPATLSEMTIFTGVDYTTANGTEALAVQPAFYQTIQYDLQNMLLLNETIMKDIQVGGNEVLR